jgi:phosphoribosylanthranilate isomerase
MLRSTYGSAAPRTVGVFVNEPVECVRAILAGVGLDWAQLHGDEPPEVLRALAPWAFKAIRPAAPAGAHDQAVHYAPAKGAPERPDLLVDAHHPGRYGGTGLSLDPAVARAAIDASGKRRHVLLAGGLTPERVAQVVSALRPWGVDVSSGVEAEPGRKDRARVRAFVAAVRAVGDTNGEQEANEDRNV